MTYEEMVAMPLHSRSCIEVVPYTNTTQYSSMYVTRVPGGWIYSAGSGGADTRIFVPEIEVELKKVQHEVDGINLTENL
jgi:hypothetical protein